MNETKLPPTAMPSSPATTPLSMSLLEGTSVSSLPREEQERMLRDLNVYRRELPRLLAEDEAGRFCLIKDAKVVSLWDTAGDALQAAQFLYGIDPVSVYEVKPQDVERLALLVSEKAAPCQP